MKNKRAIKIVKHDAPDALPAEPTADEVIKRDKKDAADVERDMVDSVKGWITERAENSRAEGMRSVSERFAWESDKESEPA